MTAPADGSTAGSLVAHEVGAPVPSTSASEASAFRDAMARLTGAVAVAACREAGRSQGLLVSSLITLSIAPPRVLFCVQKAAGAHTALLSAGRISLAVLGADHLDEAEAFTARGRREQRFLSGAWRHEAGAPPRLDRAIITLEGSVYQRISAGTHTIFIMNVEQSRHGPGDPLLYVDRGFRTLTARVPPQDPVSSGLAPL